MTSFADCLIALFVAGALNLLILARIGRLPGEEGGFLARSYSRTLLLRFALALFLNVFSGTLGIAAMFWGDSSQYDRGGYLLSLFWSGELSVIPAAAEKVTGYGMVYVVSAIYYLFGRNQLLVQFLNCTIGSVTVLVIHAIAKQLFDAEVARWAALFMAFFPQMIFWSGGMYKDTAVMFCIAIAMYATLKLREQLDPRHVALFVAASLSLVTLRFYIFYIVAVATLGTFFVSQKRGFMSGFFSQLVLLVTLAVAFSFAVSRETMERQTAYFDLDKVEAARRDQVRLADSGYGEASDVSTSEGALTSLPVGLLYLLFAPFPWSGGSLRQVLIAPEMLVWYGLMPAFLRGLMYTIRHRLRDALPILVFAGMLTVAYALFQGNVGTAYRQRTQISMFFFIFMGVGLVQKQRQRDLARAPVAPAQPAFQR